RRGWLGRSCGGAWRAGAASGGEAAGGGARGAVGCGAGLGVGACGGDERPVVTDSEPVSLSRETTFERDLHAVHDRAELGAVFTRLAEAVAADLQRKGYAGKTIGIKLRFDDFRIATRDQTVAEPTQDARRIRQIAGQCLKRVELSRRLRLLGVRVGSLVRADRLSAASDEASNHDLPLFQQAPAAPEN
ncbi:MAG: hypothetical protein E6Q65_06625, partial [Ottowia sp.]